MMHVGKLATQSHNNKYNKCVTTGQSSDVANSHFVRGALKKLAQLAAYMMLDSHSSLLLFLDVILSAKRVTRTHPTVFTENIAPYLHGDKTTTYSKLFTLEPCFKSLRI